MILSLFPVLPLLRIAFTILTSAYILPEHQS